MAIFACSEEGLQPASEPNVRQARRMVGMIVSEELYIDAADRDFQLVEPDCRAAARINQKFLVAGFNQGRRSESVGTWDRHSGSQQSHPKSAFHDRSRRFWPSAAYVEA